MTPGYLVRLRGPVGARSFGIVEKLLPTNGAVVRWTFSGGRTWHPPRTFSRTSLVLVCVRTQADADRIVPVLLSAPGERVLFITPSETIDLSEWIERIDHCGVCEAENPPHKEDICPECNDEGCTISTIGHAQAERYRTGERYDENSALGRADIEGTNGLTRVIVEAGAEPVDIEAVRKIRDDCEAAGMPCDVAT